MKTPEEAYSRKRPHVGHFRTFGSSVYFHVTKDARKKLYPIAKLGIFVGYTDTPHNYKPHVEVYKVETSTQAESSREGRKHTIEVDRLLDDAWENGGAPSSQRKKRRSLERYTRYMALMGACVVIEPSSFQEAFQQPVCVYAMMEEYNSIVQNNVWDVVLRLEDRLVVSSCWLYKVKKATDGSVEKHKAIFVARGFSKVEEINYDETFAPIARYSSIRSILAL
eukprot:PITA_16364